MVTKTTTRRRRPRVGVKVAQKRLGSAKKRLTAAKGRQRKATTAVNTAQRSLTKARNYSKHCR